MGIKLTVLFATYNGARTLPRMLEAMTRLTLPHDLWKLVAVDNNSSDATLEMLHAYERRLPLQIVSEARQGKENALATGFRYLEGDLVVLTDDDVIPDPDWLEQYLAAAAIHPEFSIFGGAITPEWEEPPAAWLKPRQQQMSILYASTDGQREGPIPALLVFGPNSAFRRNVIGDHYAAQTDLGPNASVSQYAMGQDTAFALHLEQQGARAFHCRKARVRHIVKREYVSEAWVLRRAERYGKGMVLVRPELFESKLKLRGVPVGACIKWAFTSLLVRLTRGLGPSTVLFSLRWNQQVRAGILQQFMMTAKR